MKKIIRNYIDAALTILAIVGFLLVVSCSLSLGWHGGKKYIEYRANVSLLDRYSEFLK